MYVSTLFEKKSRLALLYQLYIQSQTTTPLVESYHVAVCVDYELLIPRKRREEKLLLI